jgi:riboflavin kinase
VSNLTKYEIFPLLLELAKRNCLNFPERISRTEIIKSLDISAWRFRKLLKYAEDEGYIERVPLGRFIAFKITPRGRELLESIYGDLKRILDSGLTVELRGKVVPGLGEGAYYLSIPQYVEAFKEALGFEPFPGTLNVRLDEDSVKKRVFVRNSGKGIYIPGFTLNGKSFCGVTVYKAVISANGVSVFGAVLDIEKTKHGDEILEVISQVRLRSELKLRDGDPVEIRVML